MEVMYQHVRISEDAHMITCMLSLHTKCRRHLRALDTFFRKSLNLVTLSAKTTNLGSLGEKLSMLQCLNSKSVRSTLAAALPLGFANEY